MARIGAAVAALAGASLLAAACGRSPSSSPRVASLGSTTTTTTPLGQAQDRATPADYAKDVVYATCMRAHGLPSFPDPNAQGDFLFSNGPHGNGIRPNSPSFISANKSCEHLEPNGGAQTPAELQEALAVGLKVSECMRKHGVSNFPDPNSQGDLLIAENKLGVSPAEMSAAMKACQSLFDQYGAIP